MTLASPTVKDDFSPLKRLRNWYDRRVVMKDFLGQFLRKARRAYLTHFRKDYVRKSIAANRQGECHRCGNCCEFIYKCPFLGKDSENLPYCRIYGELRPASCKSYPFDQRDSEVDQCGFKFKN